MTKSPACQGCPLADCAVVVAPQQIGDVYFGEGPLDARVAVVGEAPWKEEEASGRYFAGKAGALLSIIVANAGLDRKSLYVTNVVKCVTLSPSAEAAAFCRKAHLDRELEHIKPNVVVGLGGVVLGALAGKTRVTKWRGYLLEVANE